MVDEELIKFLKNQISLEKKIVAISEKSVEEIKNVLVRELIRGIAMDSRKHALLLTALEGIFKGPTPLIKEDNFDKIKTTIEKHIKLELEAIETYKELLRKYEQNTSVRTIVSEIQKDEIRHHDFLLRLLKALIEKETLTNDVLEDWLYKFAPFHGSPGG